MRELKFRMYALDIQKMFEMDRLHLPCTTQPNPASVYMQYTGLKDRNGKEIFEGDILSNPDDKQLISWVVIFDEGSFKVCFPNPINAERFVLTNGMALSREVIGNIYENKDLIEGETKQ